MPLRAAQQAVAYLAAARAALGALPRKDLIVAERFFDEAGGMQLVMHAPLGGRINRAWGLALRKKFCVHVRLRAAGGGDRRRHRDLARPAAQLPARHRVRLRAVAPGARRRSIQALLDRPMFEIRWRWNVDARR